jgi:molecular chaperone GrpE
MTSKKNKIVMPTDAEVTQYAAPGPSGSPTDAQTSGSRPPDNVASPAEGDKGRPAKLPEESVDLLRTELALCKDKLLRAQAECANIAKRLTNQHAESLKLAGMDLARALLPVLDNMQRTLENLRESHVDDPVIQGVKLIGEQLGKVLQDHGVEPIQSVGQPFDPNCHEALMEDRQSDLPAGTVTMEMQRGYKIRDRVLRPARVAVAAAKNEQQEQEASPAAEGGSAEAETRDPEKSR